jgi:hypothetical protein
LWEVLARAAVSWHVGRMKRIGILAFYAVSTLAILYLALYAYAVYRGRDFTPGDPIHIFRNPEAPSYSSHPLPLWERVASRSEAR